MRELKESLKSWEGSSMVEWKKLGEICSIKTGKGITQELCSIDDPYPVMSGGQNPMGFYREYNRNEETVTISRVGANAGFVCYLSEKFYLNDKCFSVIPLNESINSKYLFFYLKEKEKVIKTLQSEGGVPTINTQKLGTIITPVIPLSEQARIVEILDTFTASIENLKQQIDERKKQYEYYRDQLIDLEGKEGVELKTLPEISINCDRERKPITSSKRVAGEYPYYGASGIVDYVDAYIFDGEYLLISEDGANLLARSTPIAFSIKGKNWVNNHAHILRFDDKVTQRFVEVYLNMISLEPWINGAAQPKLNQENLNKITIPVPSLDEQSRIVSILDTFEASIANLEAQKQAREKQYEYYRNQLLTFERNED